MNFSPGLMISVSGIRGRVGIDLNPPLVSGFAAAFGEYVRNQGWGRHLVVARDSRPSGPEFARAAIAGLQAAGCRVSDLGLVPTPTALLEIERLDASGGIIVTASHNPKEWNALKLASPHGAFLTLDQGAEFFSRIRSVEPRADLQIDAGALEKVEGAVDRHIEQILGLDLVESEKIAAAKFKIALDSAHGAGGVILTPLLSALGCEVIGIELEPDGRFSRELEPIPENLGELCSAVRRESCDLGMAVDPDVDRLALVDGTGRAIGEDYTLALATRLVLSHQSGSAVANLSTSQIVEAVCERAGAEYFQVPVGEANVAAAMRERSAIVGGEGNGGVILPALHYTRDAPLAVALILQLLTESRLALAELVSQYPSYRIVKDKVPRGEVELEPLLGEIERALEGAEIDRRDGLHLRWRDHGCWLHVRPSGTEPIVRLIAEGRGEADARSLLAAAREAIQAVQ